MKKFRLSLLCGVLILCAGAFSAQTTSAEESTHGLGESLPQCSQELATHGWMALPDGFKCITSKGAIWQKHYAAGRLLGWKGPDGNTWFIGGGTMSSQSFDAALDDCEKTKQLKYRLPDKVDFDRAEANGIRELIVDGDMGIYWSASYVDNGPDHAVFDGRTGKWESTLVPEQKNHFCVLPGNPAPQDSLPYCHDLTLNRRKVGTQCQSSSYDGFQIVAWTKSATAWQGPDGLTWRYVDSHRVEKPEAIKICGAAGGRLATQIEYLRASDTRLDEFLYDYLNNGCPGDCDKSDVESETWFQETEYDDQTPAMLGHVLCVR
jgi:hypothetical protein